MARMMLLSAGIVAAFAGTAQADVVTDWNNTLLNAVRSTNTPPPRASRAMAIVSAAVYDSAISIEGGRLPYYRSINTPGANIEAAVASAAHAALSQLFPTQQAAFDAQLSLSLGMIPDGAAKTAGINLGQTIATSFVAHRANDGSASSVVYTPGTDPGDWRPTPPAFAPALLPQWPNVTPFAMTSGSQFRPVAPPALNSPEYTAAFNEVKELGRIDSATRTAEQTDIARLWAAGGGTITPPGMWNKIAQDLGASLSIADKARMFATLNLATADAAINSWDAKYAYDFWRPVAGIREADTDGNVDTISDPTWTPLLTTPPFPAYTSGHSTFSAASAAALAAFFGTDALSFSVTGDDVAITRNFTSLMGAAEEAGISRIYGGIHWSFDNTAGLAAGEQVGNWVAGNYLLVPTPGVGAIAAVGMAGLMRRRRA